MCLQASEDDMYAVMDKLWESGERRYKPFMDEDLGDFFTAVAFRPMTETEGRKWFGSFRLA